MPEYTSLVSPLDQLDQLLDLARREDKAKEQELQGYKEAIALLAKDRDNWRASAESAGVELERVGKELIKTQAALRTKEQQPEPSSPNPAKYLDIATQEMETVHSKLRDANPRDPFYVLAHLAAAVDCLIRRLEEHTL